MEPTQIPIRVVGTQFVPTKDGGTACIRIEAAGVEIGAGQRVIFSLIQHRVHSVDAPGFRIPLPEQVAGSDGRTRPTIWNVRVDPARGKFFTLAIDAPGYPAQLIPCNWTPPPEMRN